MGGENTFTRTLLTNPPEGVEYIHHIQALKKGLIEYLPIQKVLSNLVKFRILPLSSGTNALILRDYFDLIHVHAYSLKVEGKSIPIVISDSSSNYLFLRDYLNWPEWRIKTSYALRRRLFAKLGILDCDTNWEKAKKIIVFSNFAAEIHKQLGVPSEKIKVVYPGLPSQESQKKKEEKDVNILFVGIWFERKGGLLLLEAFKILLQTFSNIKLTIVGPIPKNLKKNINIGDLSIQQKDFVPREKLLKEIFPKADILVLVPPKTEGYGFVVQEALSFGIPVIVSRVCALPEIVEDGISGFVVKPNSVEDLVEKLKILIRDKDVRSRLGKAALDRFNKKFTLEKSNRTLLKVYQDVLAT